MNEENKAKLNRFWGIWNFIEAIILLVAGILAIVVAFTNGDNNSINTESIVAYVVGAFILLDGSLRVVMSFVHYRGPNNNDETGTLVGGFELALGIVMVLLEVHFYNLTQQHVFTYLIANFIATLLIVVGLLLIAFSIVTIAKKYNGLFMPILEIIFAAILVGVGITIFILYYKQNNANIVLVLTGSVLCVASVAQGIITTITLKKAKKELKAATSIDVIDDAKKAHFAKKSKEVVAEEKTEEPKQIDNSTNIELIDAPKD